MISSVRLLFVSLIAAETLAQPLLSARSGVVTYFEGQVFIEDQVLIPGNVEQFKFRFPQIPEGGVLRTEKGRAEVLLQPGAVLWVDEGSRIKIRSNRLTEAEIELLAGSALLEHTNPQGASPRLVLVGATIGAIKRGAYGISASRNLLRVYLGEAEVLYRGARLAARSGTEVDVGGAAIRTKRFGPDSLSLFVRWTIQRSEFMGMTNCVAAARGIVDQDMPGGYWYESNVYGAAYIPSRDFCHKFLGPVSTLGVRP
jgi:hypothetical protein